MILKPDDAKYHTRDIQLRGLPAPLAHSKKNRISEIRRAAAQKRWAGHKKKERAKR